MNVRCCSEYFTLIPASEALVNWADVMITEMLDKLFYRYSMFDNYLID